MQKTAKKCTKIYNARAKPLFCSLNLLFSDNSRRRRDLLKLPIQSHIGRWGLNNEKYVAHMLLSCRKEAAVINGYVIRNQNQNISKVQFDTGMHGHFWTSSCELLGTPWVNKLHIYIHIYSKLLHTPAFYELLHTYLHIRKEDSSVDHLRLKWSAIIAHF